MQPRDFFSKLRFHDTSARHFSGGARGAKLRVIHAIANRQRKKGEKFNRSIGHFGFDDEVRANVAKKSTSVIRGEHPLVLKLSVARGLVGAKTSAPAIFEGLQRCSDCVGDGHKNREIAVRFVANGSVNGAFAIKKASSIFGGNHEPNIRLNTTNLKAAA